MYELDHSKDQVMTVFKVSLATRASARPVLPTLRYFVHDTTTVRVELRPFNDLALNRDLALLGAGVNDVSPRLPEGQHLFFTISTLTAYRALPVQEGLVT